MRRLFLAGLLLLAGCRSNLIGPFAHRPTQRVDDPLLPVSEQQRRVRDRLALPDDSPNGPPPSGVERPTYHGRGDPG